MTRLWGTQQPIRVEVDEAGLPLRFTWEEVTHPIETIANRWRSDNDWWRGQIWREHFKVATTTGLLVIIYRDLVEDCWYLQRLYD